MRCKENDYDTALRMAIKSAAGLSGPVQGCSLVIDKSQYLSFLDHLSFLLKYVNNRLEFYQDINAIMSKIEKHNSNNHQEIEDYAMLIRFFYGKANDIKSPKKAKFELTYDCNIKDVGGLKRISIDSPDYLFGKKQLIIEGVKEYSFKEKFEINPISKMNTVPYFKLSAEDMAGNISHLNLYPKITIIR